MTGLRDRWASLWPPTLAAVVVSAVGVPAAVASYRHARAVVEANGDPVMAPWLPLSVDGMLVAALVVIWVRRHRGEPAGWGPWAAFGFGMVVTVAANLAAVSLASKSLGSLLTAALLHAAPGEHDGPGAAAYLVALFPPLALAITLELVALVAYRSRVTQDNPRLVRDVVGGLPSRSTPVTRDVESVAPGVTRPAEQPVASRVAHPECSRSKFIPVSAVTSAARRRDVTQQARVSAGRTLRAVPTSRVTDSVTVQVSRPQQAASRDAAGRDGDATSQRDGAVTVEGEEPEVPGESAEDRRKRLARNRARRYRQNKIS